MQPFVLYTHGLGPNPWKVSLILEELGLPYIKEFISFSDVKKPPYVNINPNGRLPALEDPNTNITLWESGAIIEYLSGQGPYYGQAGWFTNMHPEKIPSAIERYSNEIRRVIGVLDSVLKKQDWLVGNHITYADLAFIPWQRAAPKYCGEELYAMYPSVKAWMDKMEARPLVKKVFKNQELAIKRQGM
ncbi:Bcgst6 [Penicillium atrosanguineum]|uniref:Bcgst6 n=1 Tax=Penicillium atrosanguineum TaxID=1132637 RepID=A0A9W9PWB5_9EURO|nr:Bcgst6 [Penicillium atrosanguineum]KAJ5139430.1 Bcgst6 [Penicillium atrosanguineum]KAJ5314863.1 Bcgst6 [Penicillium atrosanguineum]